MAVPEADLVTRLVAGLTEALRQDKPKNVIQRPLKLGKYYGRPSKPGDPTIIEWLEDAEVYLQQCRIPEVDRAKVVVHHLAGVARDEIKCHNENVTGDYAALKKLLRRQFGAEESVQALQKALFERRQREDESLMDFSRSLMRMHDRILEVATETEKDALKGLRDRVLIGQFVAGARNQGVRLELRRLELAEPDQDFTEMRDSARELFRDLEEYPRGSRRGASVHLHHLGTENDLNSDEPVADANVSINQVVNKSQGDTQLQTVLQQQQEILKCMQAQQETLCKQQEQITTLMQAVVKQSGTVTSQGMYEGSGRRQDRPPIRCFYCKRPGHMKHECKLRMAHEKANGGQGQAMGDAQNTGSGNQTSLPL
ncbi:uncharacterized protein LOC117305600 [Asterias rubens]|uniref:uncharacterized protein LOC117305600 n=1 Tax=Asterias rubens TaxID=7604 RepID=UPI001455A752|nr:uncharacterized protein LOC117305600 [Asterias rubens]